MDLNLNKVKSRAHPEWLKIVTAWFKEKNNAWAKPSEVEKETGVKEPQFAYIRKMYSGVFAKRMDGKSALYRLTELGLE